MWSRIAVALVVTSALQGSVAAQTQSTTSGSTASSTQTTTAQPAGGPASQPAATAAMEVETRPATTTFMGDTGLWYVPTGEVLPAGGWAGSAHRGELYDNPGVTPVSELPGTLRHGG